MSNAGMIEAEVAVSHVNRPPPRRRRRWHLPRPRTADGGSMMLALIMTVGVPLWFLVSQWWNPNYEPTAPWVWNIPGTIAMTYIVSQIWLLLVSAGRSDRIGMSDTAISGLAFASVFGTTVVVITLGFQGNYHLGGFQANLLYFLFKTTLAELVFTAWMRFLVNRRYFATAPARESHHDDASQQQ